MKKYITIAALLAAGTAFANAEIVSTGTDTYTEENYAAVTGFAFDLDLLNWEPEVNESGVFTLTSIALSSKSGANSGAHYYSGSLYAFIYEGNVTLSSQLGEKVASSTNSFNWDSSKNDNSGTWNFDSVALDFSKTYTVLFSSNGTDFTAALGNNSGKTEGIRATVTKGAVGIKHLNWNGTAFDASCGVHAVITGTAAPVPEPSAFGLLAGIGALALVAARRRRK